jgi:RNA recognition motif-containing protein
MGQGSKIIVSNLPSDVTENQIRELFNTTVGHVTRVTLSYDNRGASKGIAQVEFKRNEDATKAFQQYNKVTFIPLTSSPLSALLNHHLFPRHQLTLLPTISQRLIDQSSLFRSSFTH